MTTFVVILFVLERLATLVVELTKLAAAALEAALETYVTVTLFAMRRGLEWLADRLPQIDFLDDWYKRAVAGAIIVPALYFLSARIVGLPTPLVLLAVLLVHGGIWGGLADENRSDLSRGNHDDGFPMNF